MILLLGSAEDEPIAAVAAILSEQGTPFHWISDTTAAQTRIAQTPTTTSERGPSGNVALSLDTITAAYLRPWPNARSDIAGDLLNAVMSWADHTPALVINRPADAESNMSKPYQAGLLAQCGFRTPPTLITTDHHQALAFTEHHGRVVYKSVSNHRSHVKVVDRQELSAMLKTRPLQNCPTQFQQHIPGQEYRVHVLRDRIFTCQIITEADDYRYATNHGHDLTMRPTRIPADIADMCRHATARLGLAFSGIDLRRTPQNEWFCLEANTSPGYTYYQRLAGLDIAHPLAQQLTHPGRPRPISAAPLPATASR
jgi:glutathione synthase/RimK-type ligase-like ATP-grasp enzyme